MRLKNIILISLSVIFIILLFQIIRKIMMVSGKAREVVYEVAVEKLKQKQITEILEFKGIIEGDPQIKIYSSVPGKFEKNITAEGDFVKKDAVVSYINRDIVGFNYNLAPVKSPIDGIIIKLFFTDKGDTVMPQMPVAEIANIEKIKVILNTGEQDLNKIKKGNNAVIISTYDKNIFATGFVFSVTPFVNKDIFSGTVIIKAENKNGKFKPGQSAEIQIETETRMAFLVAEEAILTDDNGTFIFINENNYAKKKYIKTGFIKDNLVEIIGDVKEGDEVVEKGSFKLYENAKLNILEVIE